MDILGELRNALSLLAAADVKLSDAGHDLRKRDAAIASLREQLAKAERERDLAIAHDRQPYPTADAYERACAALAKWKQRAETAEARVAVIVERLQRIPVAAYQYTDDNGVDQWVSNIEYGSQRFPISAFTQTSEEASWTVGMCKKMFASIAAFGPDQNDTPPAAGQGDQA